MAYREQTLPVLFAGGVETKLDSKVVRGKMLRLENGVFTKGIGAVKRRGFTKLSSKALDVTGDITGGQALGSRGTELLQFANRKAYSYSSGLDKWREIGACESIKVNHRAVAQSTSKQTHADCATNGGIAVYAWQDSAGGCKYTVHTTEGTTLVAPASLDTVASKTSAFSRPRVHAADNGIVVFAADETANELWTVSFNVNQPTDAPTARLIASNLNATSPEYDCVDDPDGSRILLAWNSDYNYVRLAFVSGGGAIQNSPTQVDEDFTAKGTVTRIAVNISSDGEIAALAAAHSGGTHVLTYQTSDFSGEGDQSVSTDGTFTPVRMTVAVDAAYTSAFETYLFRERAGSSDNRNYVYCDLVTSSSDTHQWKQYGAGLAGCAFTEGSYIYAPIAYADTLYNTYFLIRHDQYVSVRYLPGLGEGLADSSHMPTPKNTASNVWAIAAIYRQQLESENSDVYTEEGIRAVTLDFDAANAYEVIQLGKSSYISGGMLQEYDGARIHEHGFHYAPIVSGLGSSSSSGSLTSSATYSYVFCYGYHNAQGELELGPTSAPVAVTLGGGDDTVSGTVTYDRLTAKDGVHIIGFRSLANSGEPYYRITSTDPTTNSAVNGYIANLTSQDAVSFTDKMSDATLASQEPLYTNGGILSNDPLEGGELVVAGKNRLFLSDPSDTHLIRYSHEIRDDYTPEFSPILQTRIDPEGGDLTGLAVMDDKVICFKEYGISFFAGPGPLANPDAGGSFSPAQLITTDAGCKNAKSIATTPAGIVFQSHKGIYLLTRSLQVQYIGQSVEAYNSQTITSSDLMPDRNQVRFLTSSGVTLLYDYVMQQWSTFTNHEGKDAQVIAGSYYYVRNNGHVFKESSAVNKDVNKNVKMVQETAWIRFAQYMQGFQYVRHALVLGTYFSGHTLRVKVAYDYEIDWSDEHLITSSDFIDAGVYGDGALYGDDDYYGGDGDYRYQFRIHIGKRCEAVRFYFEDMEDAGAGGASYSIQELLITGDVVGDAFTRFRDARAS